MAGCTAALQAGGNNAAALLSKLLTTHALPLHQVSVTDPTQGSCTRSTLSHTHTHTQVTGSHEGCSSGLCSCGRQDSRSRAARAGQPKAHPTGAVSRACAATGDAGGAEEAVPQPHTCRGPAGPAKPSVHATRRWGAVGQGVATVVRQLLLHTAVKCPHLAHKPPLLGCVVP